MVKKILELLSIKDENVYLKEMITDGSIRKFVIATKPKNHFCKMCSKGIEKREIKHPSKIDGYNTTFEFLPKFIEGTKFTKTKCPQFILEVQKTPD